MKMKTDLQNDLVFGVSHRENPLPRPRRGKKIGKLNAFGRIALHKIARDGTLFL